MKKLLKIVVGFLIGIVLGLFLSRNKQTGAVYKRLQEKRKKDSLYAVKLRQDTQKEIDKISKEIRDETVQNIANNFFTAFKHKPGSDGQAEIR